MTHSYHVEDPNEDELAMIERARVWAVSLGHEVDPKPELTYSGDGRVWAGSRTVWARCPVCERLVIYGEHDDSVKDDGKLHQPPQVINWVPDDNGGTATSAGAVYRLDAPCPGKKSS